MTNIPQAARELADKLSAGFNREALDNSEQIISIITAALKRCRNEALEEAANDVGTLAESHYDNEPEFSAILVAESVIRNLKEAE